MKLFKSTLLSVALATPLLLGCGGSSEPESVAEEGDIEAFLAENPDMAVDPEEEAALMADDEAQEGQ